MSRATNPDSMAQRTIAYLSKRAGKEVTAAELNKMLGYDKASQIVSNIRGRGSDGGAIVVIGKGLYVWQATDVTNSNGHITPAPRAKRETFTVVHENKNGVLIASSLGGVYLLGDKVMD